MNSTVVTLKRKKKNEKVSGKQWIGEDGTAELILSVSHVSLIIAAERPQGASSNIIRI